MAANYSFRAYIKNNYFDRVYAAATRFIETEYARIYTSINRLPEPANISLQDVAIKSIRIGDQNDLIIAFDMLVAASLSIKESIAKAPISQAILLNICCQADLTADLLDLKVNEVRLSEDHVIFYNTLLSDTLVPIIRKADLERVANKLLKKYYPDALTRPMAIDPYAFADKMGLIVVKRHLSTDYSIFGQIFFCDADDGIKAGTICVDPDANYAYRGGNVGTSIIHECVHWALHRKALAFRRLHDAGLTDLSCAADDKRTEGVLKDVSLLEWQANALAARIQMPLAMFRKQAKETLAKLHRDTGKTDTLDVIEDARRKSLKSEAATAQKRLENVLGFADRAFGESHEMVLLIASMTASPVIFPFITTYGCESYSRLSKALNFRDRDLRVLKALEDIEKVGA